jgi:translation initiation factor IF-2
MSENLTKIVVDCATGKQTILPLTPAEIAQRDQDAAAHAEAEAQRQAEAEAKAQAQASAKAKLSALGLTEEEIEAL